MISRKSSGGGGGGDMSKSVAGREGAAKSGSLMISKLRSKQSKLGPDCRPPPRARPRARLAGGGGEPGEEEI